jgi:hypothetical protein
VTIEVGSETVAVTARVIQGAERQQVWARIVAAHPFFAQHQAKITREIPVIALTPRAE